MQNNMFEIHEEIYLNLRNIMINVVSINISYIYFVTINSCQKFYEEKASLFNIPKIELIANYNPCNLKSNVEYLEICMDKELQLYKNK